MAIRYHVAMTWVNFLTPWWGLLALAAIPLVLLYLLRQRRPDQPISSTLLWSKTLADMRASHPFQKLRRNLLLLLQLLVLAALVFSRMRPIIQAHAARSLAGVIVIDATASMQTTDDGVTSRLDRAKAEAKKIVDAMRPTDQYMLLADGGGLNQVRSGFTSSKVELRNMIDAVRPADTSSDLSETLLLATTSLKAVGAKSGGNDAVVAGRIWLFSDGAGVRLPAVKELSNLLQYVKIGQSNQNAAIIRLSVTPVPKQPKTYQVFAGLFNCSDETKNVSVGLAYGSQDHIIQGKRTTIPAHGQSSILFQITQDPGKIWVLLDCPGDQLAADNVAYGMLVPDRRVHVISVSAGNPLLDRFLQTAASAGLVDATAVAPQFYDPKQQADLYILDGNVPAELPQGDILFIKPDKPVPGFKITGELDRPAIMRWKRDDPLMEYVELSEVRVFHAQALEHDGEAVELISSPTNPLLAYKDIGAARRYLCAFSPLPPDSNWFRNPSLLIMLQNMITQTRQRHFIGTPQILPAGEPAKLWDLANKAQIITPDGSKIALQPQDGSADFASTDRVGFYELAGNTTQPAFAVNLFSSTESDITPRNLINSATGGDVNESTSVARVNREIWPWLALAALIILVGEWIIYHRRLA